MVNPKRKLIREILKNMNENKKLLGSLKSKDLRRLRFSMQEILEFRMGFSPLVCYGLAVKYCSANGRRTAESVAETSVCRISFHTLPAGRNHL